MPGDLAGPLSSAFQSIVKLAKVAVLVKDEDGYYIFANSAAGALLGCSPGELIGKHMSDICPGDPRLIEMAFDRLKRDRAWSGQFPVRHPSGLVQVTCHSFAQDGPDGCTTYTDLLYLFANAQSGSTPREPQGDLTALDYCLLQLMVEGFTDAQLAVLLGTNLDDTRNLVRATIQRMDASSRTEACVRAIKRHLVT
jgi:PAS domain-containing protein